MKQEHHNLRARKIRAADVFQPGLILRDFLKWGADSITSKFERMRRQYNYRTRTKIERKRSKGKTDLIGLIILTASRLTRPTQTSGSERTEKECVWCFLEREEDKRVCVCVFGFVGFSCRAHWVIHIHPPVVWNLTPFNRYALLSVCVCVCVCVCSLRAAGLRRDAISITQRAKDRTNHKVCERERCADTQWIK